MFKLEYFMFVVFAYDFLVLRRARSISLKFIQTFNIDNPLRQPVPLVTNSISEAKFSDI